MIYLASPYSHPEFAVREQRYHSAVMATAYLLAKKEFVYSPIVHCHPISTAYKLPTDFEFWRDYDEAFILASDKLVVLMDDGWDRSVGVGAEIVIAQDAGIRIEYLEMETVKRGILDVPLNLSR